MVHDRTVWNLETKKTYVLIYFLCLSQFATGIQGFYTKFQAISRDQGAKINYRHFNDSKEQRELWCKKHIVALPEQFEHFGILHSGWRHVLSVSKAQKAPLCVRAQVIFHHHKLNDLLTQLTRLWWFYYIISP